MIKNVIIIIVCVISIILGFLLYSGKSTSNENNNNNISGNTISNKVDYSSANLPAAPFTEDAINKINESLDNKSFELEFSRVPQDGHDGFKVITKYADKAFTAAGYSLDKTVAVVFDKNEPKNTFMLSLFMRSTLFGPVITGITNGGERKSGVLDAGAFSARTISLFDSKQPDETRSAANTTSASPSKVTNNAQQTPTVEAINPSFNCAKASTASERLICSDRNLAKADVILAQAYKATLANATNATSLKQEQISWVKNKRDVCNDVNSMLKVYEDRIAQLSK